MYKVYVRYILHIVKLISGTELPGLLKGGTIMYNTGKMVGIAVGIMVGLVLCLILYRVMNKDGKIKTQYDEMQQIIRGKGYKYAFYAILICEALLIPLSVGDVRLPFDNACLHFLIIFIGVVIHITYCIFKDAYVGLNTNMKRFMIIMIVAAVINFLSAFAAFKEGSMILDGQFQTPFINLLCGFLFVILAIELLIKKMIDNRTADN